MIVDKRTRRRLASTTRFADIRELASVDSTNRYLLDLARAAAPEGVVVVADHQTAGSGRLGRTWQSRAGQALLVSVLLRPTHLPADRRHLLMAALALSAADACRVAAGVEPAIKWPNDLLIDDRKLAGILAVADGDGVVVGLGLNVGWAPPGAISLMEAAPMVVVERGAVLAGMLEALEGWYGRWDEVAAAYRGRCQTLGRRIRAELPGRVVTGRAEVLDEWGRLQVAVDGSAELVVLSAADVVHLRPGAAG
jgi:BirA family biotin operon repressor/biotin-[acetyl-CoA-carboxylase] ligase